MARGSVDQRIAFGTYPTDISQTAARQISGLIDRANAYRSAAATAPGNVARHLLDKAADLEHFARHRVYTDVRQAMGLAIGDTARVEIQATTSPAGFPTATVRAIAANTHPRSDSPPVARTEINTLPDAQLPKEAALAYAQSETEMLQPGFFMKALAALGLITDKQPLTNIPLARQIEAQVVNRAIDTTVDRAVRQAPVHGDYTAEIRQSVDYCHAQAASFLPDIVSYKTTEPARFVERALTGKNTVVTSSGYYLRSVEYAVRDRWNDMTPAQKDWACNNAPHLLPNLDIK